VRLSTSLIYTQGYEAIARKQGELTRTQQQVASGTRIATPADDPIGAAQAISLTQSSNETQLLAGNVSQAMSILEGNDALLSQLTDLLSRVRTLAVNGGSAGLSASDRASIASDIAEEAQALMALGNTRSSDGKYVFSGLSTDVAAFADTPGGVVYNGDQGVHEIQVGASRFIPANLTGSAVFMQPHNGDGAVTMRAAAANVGLGVIASGSVVNPAAVNGHAYRLAFTVAAGVTTYDVLDTTTATTLSSGNAYVDGAAINVGGMQTSVRGAPANGDAFTMAPSGRQSLFTTLANLVSTLNTPASSAGVQAQVSNGIAAALQDLDQGLDSVLALRAGTGAQLRELDTLEASLSARDLAYQQSISKLRDLDYDKALSDFARQQLALQAAQQSFVKVSGLSLFDYLKF